MCVAFAAAVVIVSGCGPARRPTVETAKVSGTVKLDGAPLDGAQVNFVAADYAGLATTDSSGHYELDAQPGENTVYIRKFEGNLGSDPRGLELQSDTGEGNVGPKQLLPPKYSDPEKTELKFTVPDAGATNADFGLSSK
jgi:hypothetical protein